MILIESTLIGEILMQIDYINGPKTDKIFGMSKYQMEINKRLKC